MNGQRKPVVVEMDVERVERDREECVALYKKAEGGNRELAQWLLDHPRYSGRTVAGWLNCGPRRIEILRAWAKRGFSEAPFGSKNQPRSPRNAQAPAQEPLKSHDNFENDIFEPDENIECPKQVLINILDSIKQYRAVGEAYRKILKVSPFDREAKKQINDEIESLIRKWRSVQSTLTAKGKTDVQQGN
jgi:hypothetical protein